MEFSTTYKKRINMNTLALTKESVLAIVNASNSFDKETLKANRALITECRKEKREKLGGLDVGQIAHMIQIAVSKGYTLADIKDKTGVRSDTMSFVLKRKDETSALEAKIARDMAKLAKLKAA